LLLQGDETGRGGGGRGTCEQLQDPAKTRRPRRRFGWSCERCYKNAVKEWNARRRLDGGLRSLDHQALSRRKARTQRKSVDEIGGAEDSTTGSLAGGLRFVFDDDDGNLGWSGIANDGSEEEDADFFPMVGKRVDSDCRWAVAGYEGSYLSRDSHCYHHRYHYHQQRSASRQQQSQAAATECRRCCCCCLRKAGGRDRAPNEGGAVQNSNTKLGTTVSQYTDRRPDHFFRRLFLFEFFRIILVGFDTTGGAFPPHAAFQPAIHNRLSVSFPPLSSLECQLQSHHNPPSRSLLCFAAVVAAIVGGGGVVLLLLAAAQKHATGFVTLLKQIGRSLSCPRISRHASTPPGPTAAAQVHATAA
jgi:hypothetical protein